MNFDESIMLNNYSDKATEQFDEMQNRLSEIKGNFQTRMNGKTMGGLVGSFIGTFLWLAAFIVAAILVINLVDRALWIISVIPIFGLMLFMIIDSIISFSYYGKIEKYRKSISYLKDRINVGRSAIGSNNDAFWESKSSGWFFELIAGKSIPEEATSIEATMSNMESLKMGFVNGAKNVFFYAAVVMITIVGCVALFPTSSGIIIGISGATISNNTLLVLNVIALIIVGVGEIILAKLVWSATDCEVNNCTLLIALVGPLAFLLLIVVATLLVMLVIAIISIILVILGIAAAIAVAIGCLSGG